MLLFFAVFVNSAISQNALPDTIAAKVKKSLSEKPGIEKPKKRTFFIAPFYQYAKYSNLKLVSHTNHFIGEDGESNHEFSEEQIDDYNSGYNTEYVNSMTAVKFGYHLLDGFGVSAYLGASHFSFTSWASDEGEQNHNTQNPALTLGLAFDYEKTVYKNLNLISMVSAHYINTNTAYVDGDLGEDVASSKFKALNWQLDLGLSYQLGKFTPYAGGGFTQQYVNSVVKEQLLTTDINGADFYETMEFDAQFSESSFYGFAGLEYRPSKHVAMYANITFTNPLRATFGLKINL
jgi:hypothetical protein